jgi:hypothetical protein
MFSHSIILSGILPGIPPRLILFFLTKCIQFCWLRLSNFEWMSVTDADTLAQRALMG